MTHTYCDASWNTENQDIREAVEQSAQRGQSCAWWEGREGHDLEGLMGRLNLHPSLPPRPTHIQANGVLTYTTLPDMLKPVVPGDEEGREGRGWTY